MSDEWHQTACILCSVNCGIEVRLDGRRIERVRGDKAHPTSLGYTCEKALRLDHYQNGHHRLTSPLRRRPDGSFERIDWDTAIGEVAERLGAIRDTHGGASIFYYGGGGQANHLGGGYGRATRSALGTVYSSNALAQEKTGEFWVDGQLFGRPRCHTTGDYEHAEVAMFVGKNPWQSHGFPRARTVLKAIVNDPGRSLIVIDPRRSETAEMADHHLQVRPGTDAWCLAALLGVLVEESLIDVDWLDAHADGLDELRAHLAKVPIAECCAIAGVSEDDVRAVARRIATAASVSVYEDLGIQQAPYSTLNSYLEKLLYLVTGNFAKKGGMNIHSRFASLGGGGKGGGDRRSPVGGHRIITGLVPSAVIPDEILTDHPNRFRAMLIESANPVHSLPDSARMREALEALDCVVVIDVALTETARCADYVLPAASQYEKWEAAFFTLEFPENAFQLRAPIFEPLEGTLPEAEIHARLVRALGAYTDDDLAGLHAAAALGRAAYADAFLTAMVEQPHLAPLAPIVLYETLGPTLGEGRAGAAAVWGLAQTCFLTHPESVQRAGYSDGDALFDAMLANPSGVVFTVDDYDETWKRLDTPDGKVNLVIPDLLEELSSLPNEAPTDADYPFVLSAGERRSSTANTIFRDPAWRKKDGGTALRMNPDDAARVGVEDGGRVRVVTRRGAIEAPVEITDAMQPGHVSLPNGLGLTSPDNVVDGVPPNELTSSTDRDWLAGTPWHKHVRARLEAVA
ncbi:MAG TPA: molybdopterin-dependent oxidoreductase [Acidimicrobiales bacterium]|nr:molybdopterin-dependent oxidoreductase [Acidimicrobiales bacterium]